MATRRRPPPSRPGAARRRGRQSKLLPAVFLIAAAIGLALILVNLTGESGDAGGTSRGSANTDPLHTGQPPWPPVYDGLARRTEVADFPAVGDESYHVHTLLTVFVDGEKVEVPANIGIDQRRRFISPLHTHTPDGIIHFEADDPSPFTISQIFSIWGVSFDANRLGGNVTQGARRVWVFVDGQAVQDPSTYELEDKDNIVVAYGAEGSFPVEPAADALNET